MADVFVSYARADKARVAPLVAAIEAKGWSVWWDPEITPGQEFDDQIDAEIDAAKAVLVIWTPTSVASRWVRAEATLADRRNKLVPAIIEACDRPIVFELTHTAELSDWHGDTSDVRWRQFVHDLHRMIDTAASREAPATPKEEAAPEK